MLGPGRLARSNPWALRLAAAFLFVLCLVWAAPGHAVRNTPIFMLHSYSQEYPWTKRQHEGFLRELGARVPDAIDVSVEYLDSKRVPYTTAYAYSFAGKLAQKYAALEPKLIYVTDDNALLFALAHLTRIFPKAPIFFSGINDYGMKQRIDPRQVTGVFENKEIAPNLDLMRQLAPGVRDILVVGDESETYQAIRHEIVAELAHQPDIQAQFLSHGGIERMVAALQGRKEQFVFLTTLGAMTDAAGNTLTLPETIAAIVQAGRFVIISMEDVYLYPGVLGGYVTSGYKQGAAAAELGARYLAGTAVVDIKPIGSSPNEYIIDGGELGRLGLTMPHELAGRTTILNPLPTFYERNLKLVVHSLYAFALLFVASLAASIYALMRKNQQIARTSKNLEAQAELMKEVQGNLVSAQRIARIGSWEWTPGSDSVTWSEGLHLILRRDLGSAAPTLRSLPQSCTPESWARLEAAVARTLETGTPYELELEMNREDGSTCWTTARGEAVPGPDGAVVKLRGTVHDITERKRAEHALRASEERHRRLFESSRDALMTLAPPSWRFTSANQATLELFRAVSASAFIQLGPWNVSPERQPDGRLSDEKTQEMVATAMREGEIVFEWEHQRLDGSLFPADVWITRMDLGGEVFLQATVRDMTERKRAETARDLLEGQLRESQKMEALGTLAGGVAHDFNNALAAIIGNVELARQDIGSGHAALVSLEEIGKASRRAKDLVQQILAFGRRQKLERKVMSLALVVVESARLLRATLPANVSLSVDCRPDTPAVLADATQVNQILLNLCSNAMQSIQAQARPGAIEVCLSVYDLTQGEAHGELRPGRYACLTVRDNGSGMDEATRARIFEPFFTTKPMGKGTGLGLSVVHGIVEAHAASLEVESTPGEGSEFIFPQSKRRPRTSSHSLRTRRQITGRGSMCFTWMMKKPSYS